MTPTSNEQSHVRADTCPSCGNRGNAPVVDREITHDDGEAHQCEYACNVCREYWETAWWEGQ